MTSANIDTKLSHESIPDGDRGRSTVTRRLVMNMFVSTAVAGTAINPTDAATTDPIFAAIDAHKAARANVSAQVSEHSRLESLLPRDKRKSSIGAWEEKIVETDDPRWIESERAVGRSFDAETDAACVLVSVHPTTIAGVLALLRYANSADIDGEAWPSELLSDDGTKTRSWHYFLIEALAEALPGMVSA